MGCGATPVVEPTLARTSSVGAPADNADEHTIRAPIALVRRGLELLPRARQGDVAGLWAVAEELASTLPQALGDRTTRLYREVTSLLGDPVEDARRLDAIESILRSFDRECFEMPPWVRELAPCAENGGDLAECQELWPGHWVRDHGFCRSDLECGDSFSCVADDGRGAYCQRSRPGELGPG